MLAVDREIEQHRRQHHFEPERQVGQREQPPAAVRGDLRHGDRQERKQQPERQAVGDHDGQVGEPAPGLVHEQRAARRGDFPHGHDQEHACETGEPDGGFLVETGHENVGSC